MMQPDIIGDHIRMCTGELFGVRIHTPHCHGCGAWYLGDEGDHMDSDDYEIWFDQWISTEDSPGDDLSPTAWRNPAECSGKAAYPWDAIARETELIGRTGGELTRDDE